MADDGGDMNGARSMDLGGLDDPGRDDRVPEEPVRKVGRVRRGGPRMKRGRRGKRRIR